MQAAAWADQPIYEQKRAIKVRWRIEGQCIADQALVSGVAR